MYPTRSTRRLPWRISDLLPTSHEGWRLAATVCLVLSTVVGALAVLVGSLAAVWTYGDFRKGEVSLGFFALFAFVYGAFIVGPAIGWILGALSRFRWAIAVSMFPFSLYGLMWLVAASTR